MSLGDLRKSIGTALYRQLGRANSQVQNHRSLPVDILENDTAYQVVFDTPGAEPDDVQVRYLEGTVKIQVDRFREYRDGFEMLFPGRGMELDGEADLPDDAVVDPDSGTATLTEAGTLRIDIPKASSLESEEADAVDESDAVDATSDAVDATDSDAGTDELTAND